MPTVSKQWKTHTCGMMSVQRENRCTALYFSGHHTKFRSFKINFFPLRTDRQWHSMAERVCRLHLWRFSRLNWLAWRTDQTSLPLFWLYPLEVSSNLSFCFWDFKGKYAFDLSEVQLTVQRIKDRFYNKRSSKVNLESYTIKWYWEWY